MLIVDSQVHIWGADTPERPWPKRAEAQRPIPLDKDDLLREMNEAGGERGSSGPPAGEGERNDRGIEAATNSFMMNSWYLRFFTSASLLR